MRSISRNLGRLRRDRSGQTAITFGLAAVPMLIVVGSAIDYSRAVAQRSNLQQATDSAALAIAHSYLNSTSTVASLTPPTQTYLTGAMNGATLTSLALATSNSKLCIKTTFSLPTSIMAVFKVATMNVGAYACATPGTQSSFEVALALDNSGSMSDSAGGVSKISALKTATQKLVDILNPSGTTKPNAAISLVPFTALVNVGTNTSASFLDTSGKSSIHWQNFHRPPTNILSSYYPKSKLDLFASLKSASWGGCVEERPVPFTTTDTAADASNPDTLFVPFLSPDDPGDTNPDHCLFINPVTQAVTTSCSFGTLGSGLLNTHQFGNSYISDTGAVNPTLACLLNPLSVTMDTIQLPLLPSDNQPNYYPLGGATMVCKYNGGKVVSTYQGVGLSTGPNYLCSSPQLTSLTTDRTVLSSAVSAMQAGGSTNLATGFMWAWRTISPTVNPFPISSPGTIGQQNPKSYAAATASPPNQKIIILMTDGYNAWTTNGSSPFLSTYEAFGYYVNNRIASYGSCTNANYTLATDANSYRCQMDNVTLEACANAKKAGVQIYTVGFTVSSNPIDDQGINLLKTCASSASNYFQASTGDGIVTAFQQIAQQIQGLRLTQ